MVGEDWRLYVAVRLLEFGVWWLAAWVDLRSI